MATKFNTREEWLTEGIALLNSEVFAAVGETVPAVRVSVGWPGGRGSKNSVIGQCWASRAAGDNVAQIFISPVLEDGVRVLDVLVHELIHAIDDCQSGHRGRFAKIARAVGLEGKLTATAAGEALSVKLSGILAKLGDFPHAALVNATANSGPKKQGTRMLKVECPADGYIVRTTQKWLDLGVPTCPCGTEMVAA